MCLTSSSLVSFEVGWYPANHLGGHCGPGLRPSCKLERTLYHWDHSSETRLLPLLFTLPLVASCCCSTLGLPWPCWPGLKFETWSHCLDPGNLKERIFPQVFGDEGREVTQCRTGKAGQEPCYFPYYMSGLHTHSGIMEGVSYLPCGPRERPVWSLQHLEIMGPDKNKEFSRFSTEIGSSCNGEWSLFACLYLFCVCLG